MGIEILAALHRLYPEQFQLQKAMTLVCSQSTMDALKRGDDPKSISAAWSTRLHAFENARSGYLIYP
jgi:hypothetical protein